MTQLAEEDDYVEIEKAKETLRLNLPIQLGYFILQYAKLHMLQFYYDFMDTYVDRADFEYCEMDTDSAYMALSGPDFLSVIKPDMKARYLEGLEGYCKPGPVIADCQKHWFPRTCCSTHANYDRRTPGLFKIEYEGDAMIGLCSKTYIVAQKKSKITPSTVLVASRLLRKAKRLRRKQLPKSTRRVYYETKFSSKGISKKTVVAPLTTFRQVMKTQKPGSGTNIGFRARNNTMYTYQQKRSGFSYFYCKRRVLNDGRSTMPLDMELCPARHDEEPMQVDEEEATMEWNDQDQDNVNVLVSLMEED